MATRAPWSRPLLMVLAGLLLSGPASAQIPPVEPPPLDGQSGDQYLSLNLGVPGNVGYVFVRPGGQARIPIEVEDASADRAQDARNPVPHMIQLEARIASPRSPPGWSVTVANSTHFTQPGQIVYSTIVVNALYAAVDNYITIEINGTLTGPDGTSRVTDGMEITVQLLPFYAGRARVLSTPAVVGQRELVTYEIQIENQATYPDWFQIHLNASPGYAVSAPPRIYVPPLESRVVNLSIFTPQTSLYEWGKLAIVQIEIRSQSDPAFRYTTSAILTVKGFYMPAYWIPLTLFAIVGSALATTKWRAKAAEAAAREGRPRRPQPTPRQAVLLKELKKRDPAAYKERMSAFAAVYKARRATWLAERKARRAEERKLEREQRAAAKQEKKRRKEQKRLEAEREAALAKLRKEKLAEIHAKRAALEKIKAKEAKVQAKADAKRMKELTKLQKTKAKELAKARKAAEKERLAAEKAAKKAAKKAGKGGKPPSPPGSGEGPSPGNPNE